MKRLRRTAVLVATALIVGCASTTDPEVDAGHSILAGPLDVTLAKGEDRVIEGTVLRMTFASVLADSRCPSDVVCVWEGNATVEIGIGAGTGPTFPLHLNTSLEPRSGEAVGVRVTLLELTPAPLSTVPIDPSAYRVRLRLEPAG